MEALSTQWRSMTTATPIDGKNDDNSHSIHSGKRTMMILLVVLLWIGGFKGVKGHSIPPQRVSELQEIRKRFPRDRVVTVYKNDTTHHSNHPVPVPYTYHTALNDTRIDGNTKCQGTNTKGCAASNATSHGSHGSLNDRRRRALSSSNVVCKVRRNTTLHGGSLPNGPARIMNVPTAAACCSRCAVTDGCAAWAWSRKLNICYPRASQGWTIVASEAHVSGFPENSGITFKPPQSVTIPVDPTPVQPGPNPTHSGPSRANPKAGTLYWQGKLTVGDNQLRQGFAKEIKTVKKANNKVVIRDPTGHSNDTVIKTMYNRGCWAPVANCGGGALFYAWPKGSFTSIGDAARLEYDVYFPAGFDFVKGGKLPGLVGGGMGCSGGANAGARKCWSVRLMWRTGGMGEAYMYVDDTAQASDFCSDPRTVCDFRAGISMQRGAFTFKTGRWTHIALTVKMNDVGKQNGLVQIDVDGETKVLYEKVVYRTPSAPHLTIDALFFATWFGGGDKSWAPKVNTETYWKNLQIYTL